MKTTHKLQSNISQNTFHLKLIFLTIIILSSFLFTSIFISNLFLKKSSPISLPQVNTSGDLQHTDTDFTDWTHSNTLGIVGQLSLDTETRTLSQHADFGVYLGDPPELGSGTWQDTFTRGGDVWYIEQWTDYMISIEALSFNNPDVNRQYSEVTMENYIYFYQAFPYSYPGALSISDQTSHPTLYLGTDGALYVSHRLQWCLGNVYHNYINTRAGSPIDKLNMELGGTWQSHVIIEAWKFHSKDYDDTAIRWDYSELTWKWLEYQTGTATSPVFSLGDTDHPYKKLKSISIDATTPLDSSVQIEYYAYTPTGESGWQTTTDGGTITDADYVSEVLVRLTLTPESTLKQITPKVTRVTIDYGDPPGTHLPLLGSITQTPDPSNVGYLDPVDVSCQIDSGFSTLTAAEVWYTIDPTWATYTSVVMTPPPSAGTSIYTGIIPALDAVGTTVYYKIHAVNPEGTTDSAPKSYTIIDNIAPDVTHDTTSAWVHPSPTDLLPLALDTTSITIECEVIDEKSTITSVNLLLTQTGYKNAQLITDQKSYPMTFNSGTGYWSAEVQLVFQSGAIEYQIEAYDSAGNKKTTPTYSLEKWFPYIFEIQYTESDLLNGGLFYGELVTYSIKMKNMLSTPLSFTLNALATLYKPDGNVFSQKSETLQTEDLSHNIITINPGDEYTFTFDFSIGWSGGDTLEWEYWTGDAWLGVAIPNPPDSATYEFPEDPSWNRWEYITQIALDMKVTFVLEGFNGQNYDFYEDSVKSVKIPPSKISEVAATANEWRWGIACQVGMMIFIAATPFAGDFALLTGILAVTLQGISIWQFIESQISHSQAMDPPSNYTDVFTPDDVQIPNMPWIEIPDNLPQLAIINRYNVLIGEIIKLHKAYAETIDRWHSAYLDQEVFYQKLQAGAIENYSIGNSEKMDNLTHMLTEIPEIFEASFPEEDLNSPVWNYLADAQTELKNNETFFNMILDNLQEKFIPWGFTENQIYSSLIEAANFIPEEPEMTFIDLLQNDSILFNNTYKISADTLTSIQKETKIILDNTNNPQNHYNSSSLLIEPSEIEMMPGETNSFLVKIANPTTDSILINFEINAHNLPYIITPTDIQIAALPLEITTLSVEITIPESYEIIPQVTDIDLIATPIDVSISPFISSLSIKILPFYKIVASISPTEQIIFDSELATYQVDIRNLGNVPELFHLDIEDLEIGDWVFKYEGDPLIDNSLEFSPGEQKSLSLEIDPKIVIVEGYVTVQIHSEEISTSVTTSLTIYDDDNTPPIITISYIGSKTDGDPGYWEVIAFDESGLLQNPSGFYYLTSDLGLQTISVIAEDADNDILDDSLTTIKTDSISIVDDDIVPPLISDLKIEVSLNLITVSFTAIDLSGIKLFQFMIDGEPITPKSQTQIDNFYVFELEFDRLLEIGTHELQITAVDGDMDRGTIDQLSTTVSEFFEISFNDMRNFVLHEIDDFIKNIQESSEYVWRDPTNNRKSVMINKLSELKILLSTNEFEAAYDKLLHDIKPKLTGLKTDEDESTWGNGLLKNPWVLCNELQEYYKIVTNQLLFDIKTLNFWLLVI